MNRRFISNVGLALGGATVAVASQAFRASVTGWLIFGLSLGALVLLAIVRRDSERGVQRLLDIAIGALAVWSAVASVVYTGTMLTWLSFAEAIGFVVLAVLGLVAHEVRTERTLHALEPIPGEAREEDEAEELEAAA
jgi:hypothetical protein